MNLDHNADFTQVVPVAAADSVDHAAGVSAVAGESGPHDVFAADWICVASEAEVLQRDGGPRRLRHQLQHGAVCDVCAATGVPAAVCGDADEYW